MSSERAFIESLRALAGSPAARGLQDDCAVLELGGETLVVTHDMLVEGVHYLAGADMADVAWKLVATNLSDLAAKGAEPLGVMLGYMLGPQERQFLSGLEEALTHYSVPLLGGDTSSGGPPRCFGLTAFGRATHTPVPSRSGATPGDALYLTGPVGGAMMGFDALRTGNAGAASSFTRPQARLVEGRSLAPFVTSMMDVSDGLLLDASRIARASGVTLSIQAASVPLADGVAEMQRQQALRWGEDYVLLFTAPQGATLPIPAHRIGAVQELSKTPILLDGAPLRENDQLGYEHS